MSNEENNLPEEVEQSEIQHVEFSWESLEQATGSYSAAEFDELEKMYAETFNDVDESGVIDGVVTAISDREAIIEIGTKSEGVISLNEFRYKDQLSVGDTIEVVIDQREDKNGALKLSHKKARSIRSWEKINDAFDNEQTLQGFVKCRTKGGMIVDVYGIEAFLPGSQIDVKPIRDYDQYVNRTMEFKVVKINHEFKNVVVSHKALIEADIELQKKEIISKLDKGQVLEGVVKNITSYGVFVDLGGIDGLIHITDLSWSRINHPSEIVQLDEKINVVILDFDEKKSRIQLGIKQLTPHPWEAVADKINIGDTVKGRVVVLADYGVFVEVLPGVEGLLHVSEMSWSTNLRSASDFVKVGDEIQCQVLTFDKEDRKLSLGLKQLTPDPWSDIMVKYPPGTTTKGIVRNFTNFGMFVELENGVDGLIHISDLSWTEKIKHPSDFCKSGDELEVKVLVLDVENRRLSLGHKQIFDNPWEAFESIFAEGSEHTGKVVEVFDKGAHVLFEEEKVRGFCPNRHMKKEDGGVLKKGDSEKFRVIEFNKDSQKIILSHTVLFREDEVKDDRSSSANNAPFFTKQSAQKDKPTLGDNDVLAALKDKMENDEN